ncbi:kinase-like domain-containing protein [Cytidiella melzeri]|nr:kinase-like domain-containing protein [Cytidiella melzeri]
MTIFSTILPDFVNHTLNCATIQLRLLRRIGTGAYGIVYLAQDLATPASNPRFYAVKCMLKFERGSELEAAQKREIAYHSSLTHHPNITTLHCVIEEQHYVYMLMDYYEGGDLFSAVVERRRFAGNDAMVKVGFVELLDAVQACHVQGIFHRDLKPENVLCSASDGRLFLSDFGLATQLEQSNGFRCGSPHYMSPECIGTDQLVSYSTRQSDVWSLGVILVNMMTGQSPWGIATSEDSGYWMYLHDSAEFLRQVLPMISREAAAILGRIFDPNPSTRVSIPELREMILTATTLFASGDERSEGLGHTSESFPITVEDNTMMDVTFDSPCANNSNTTAAFVSIHIVTSSEFVCGADSSPTAGVDRQFLRSDVTMNWPPVYSNPALAAVKQERAAIWGSRKRARGTSLREGRVAKKMYSFVGAFHRMTARA